MVYGGDKDPQTRYFQPTVVTDVAHDDKLMEVGVANMWLFLCLVIATVYLNF